MFEMKIDCCCPRNTPFDDQAPPIFIYPPIADDGRHIANGQKTQNLGNRLALWGDDVC